MTRKPLDLERLIHESLEQLKWNADPRMLADRVRRLDIGLPLEDEFSIICGWLGKCRLIHKLDQQQYPASSKSEYQVPDLLACFNRNDGSSITTLIEVKNFEGNVLSLKPEYRAKLNAYSDLLNVPILVAWKRWGIWCLVSLEEFKMAKRNFNLNFNDAIQNSLLSYLAGDFSYSLSVNAGVHISARKVELVNVTETAVSREEEWNSVIEEVYFTNGNNEKIRDLSRIAQQVFFSWDLEEEETKTDTHIILHNYCKEQTGLFAHMALTRLLSFHIRNEGPIHWRSLLRDEEVISNISDYRKGIEENRRAGIVHHIIDVKPVNMPFFLR